LVGVVAAACQATPSAPVGTLENPVRADAFHGELEYLGRLRCRDGTAPQTQGIARRYSGSGHLIRAFRVRCIYLNEEHVIFFDPHHPGHVDTRPVPGFALAETVPPLHRGYPPARTGGGSAAD
jgi:hypothetical protein